MQIMAATSVNRELTAAAVGAFPIQYGVGRVIGGIGGGFLVAAAGVPAALVVSGAALALAGLMLVGIPYGQELIAQRTNEKARPAAAFRWLVTNPAAVTLLTLAGLTSLITSSYLAVLPAIAVAGLGAGATGLGLLTAASGVGILGIILISDWVGGGFGKARLLLALVGGTAVALVALAISTTIAVAAVATGISAGLLMLFISNSSLVLQALSPTAIKGQAVSILSLIYWGVLPVGAVLVGSAADRFGARVVLVVCAVLSIVFVLAIAAVRRDFTRIDVDSSGQQVDVHPSARERPPGKEVMP
jgi:hypothetical protein